jgi:hypothetical protein
MPLTIPTPMKPAQQNKQSNTALSVSRKPIKPVSGKPVMSAGKPKAVLNKQN